VQHMTGTDSRPGLDIWKQLLDLQFKASVHKLTAAGYAGCWSFCQSRKHWRQLG
jgi:hypothetical protein